MNTKIRAKRTRRKVGSLSRERILEATRTLIERDGLSALSMPALAREVGSGVTSLYWYFTDKRELVDTVTHDVLTEIHQQLPQIADGPWEDVLIAHFNELRRALIEHRAYRELIAYDLISIVRRPPVPLQAERIQSGFDLLAQEGLTRPQGIAVMSTLSSYTRGFVVLEVSALESADESVDEVSEPTLVDEFARLDDEHFSIGLRFILAGVRAQYPFMGAPAEH